MNTFMTFNAHGNHIEPVFWLVAFIVMVFLCLLATLTKKAVRARHFATRNSVINTTTCCKFLFISLVSCSLPLFAFGSAPAFMVAYTVCFGLPIGFCIFPHIFFVVWPCFSARFTTVVKTVGITAIFVKLRNVFYFFAVAASFCYNWFRHGFFLFKKLCLRAVQTQYLFGSLYITNSCTFCQGENLGI